MMAWIFQIVDPDESIRFTRVKWVAPISCNSSSVEPSRENDSHMLVDIQTFVGSQSIHHFLQLTTCQTSLTHSNKPRKLPKLLCENNAPVRSLVEIHSCHHNAEQWKWVNESCQDHVQHMPLWMTTIRTVGRFDIMTIPPFTFVSWCQQQLESPSKSNQQVASLWKDGLMHHWATPLQLWCLWGIDIGWTSKQMACQKDFDLKTSDTWRTCPRTKMTVGVATTAINNKMQNENFHFLMCQDLSVSVRWWPARNLDVCFKESQKNLMIECVVVGVSFWPTRKWTKKNSAILLLSLCNHGDWAENTKSIWGPTSDCSTAGALTFHVSSLQQTVAASGLKFTSCCDASFSTMRSSTLFSFAMIIANKLPCWHLQCFPKNSS